MTVGKNRLYASQGRAATNELAERARSLFRADGDLARDYNKTMAGGKWNHMMDQVHIGYTYWQDPPRNVMPEVRQIEVPSPPAMGVAIEGSAAWWPDADEEAILPALNTFQSEARSIEVFNRGQTPFEFTAQAGVPWLRIEPARGEVAKEQRIRVSVDWEQAPTGTRRVPIDVTGANGRRVVVQAMIDNPASPKPEQVQGFVEAAGYVSIEAEHSTRAVNAGPIHWRRIPDYGRTLSAMTAFPVTAPSQTLGGSSPHLEYRMHLSRGGDLKVLAYLAPTLNFTSRGLRYAISFDEETLQVFDIHASYSEADWERSVKDGVTIVNSRHSLASAGEHVLKFWMVDPGVVLEKIVVDNGGLKPSYLGPPESFYRAPRTDP